MRPEMRRKFWWTLVICFFVEMCVGNELMDHWRVQEAGKFLAYTGLLGFLASLIGGIVHNHRYPPCVCPHCGAPVPTGRHAVRKSGDARRGVVRCPRCGAMLEP